MHPCRRREAGSFWSILLVVNAYLRQGRGHRVDVHLLIENAHSRYGGGRPYSDDDDDDDETKQTPCFDAHAPARNSMPGSW